MYRIEEFLHVPVVCMNDRGSGCQHPLMAWFSILEGSFILDSPHPEVLDDFFNFIDFVSSSQHLALLGIEVLL